METWKPVAGQAGYEISDMGRVRTLDRECWNGWAWWIKPGQILKPQRAGRGYRKVTMSGKQRYVHALVLEAFVGPRPEGWDCLHGNDDRADNRLANLKWGTKQQNSHETVERKRFPAQRRTRCPYGHELKDPNLVESLIRRGHRGCKACARARGYIYHLHPEMDHQTLSDQYYAKLMGGFS